VFCLNPKESVLCEQLQREKFIIRMTDVGAEQPPEAGSFWQFLQLFNENNTF